MIPSQTPSRPGEVLATIRSRIPGLQPTEQAVAAVLLARSAEIVELNSQQVADAAGASRATVVRTCQSLGFAGYQQLRVLLARDAGYRSARNEGAADAAADAQAGDAASMVQATFRHVAATAGQMSALLDAAAVNAAIEVIAAAGRILVVGNGLSAPLASDVAARMTGIGRPAQAPTDVMNQQITARLLHPDDALIVISGSGANVSSLRAAAAACAAGATVLAVTAFDRTPLTELATISLIATMPDLTFREEITLTSRLPQTILIEALVAALAFRLGETASAAKALALDALSDNLVE